MDDVKISDRIKVLTRAEHKICDWCDTQYGSKYKHPIKPSKYKVCYLEDTAFQSIYHLECFPIKMNWLSAKVKGDKRYVARKQADKKLFLTWLDSMKEIFVAEAL